MRPAAILAASAHPKAGKTASLYPVHRRAAVKIGVLRFTAVID